MEWVVNMDYKVTEVGGWFGKRRVSYQCGRCLTPLENRLDEAGRADKCPVCGAEFVVPGEAELRAHRKAEERAREAEVAERKVAQERAARLAREKAERETAKAEERARIEREHAEAALAKAAAKATATRRPHEVVAYVAIAMLVASIVAMYVAVIRPLERRATTAEGKIAALAIRADAAEGRLSALARKDDLLDASIAGASWRTEVVAARASDAVAGIVALDRRIGSVDGNVLSLRLSLLDVARLAENGNRHAHTHLRY